MKSKTYQFVDQEGATTEVELRGMGIDDLELRQLDDLRIAVFHRGPEDISCDVSVGVREGVS